MCVCVLAFACMYVCVCVRVCSAEASGPAAGGASVWPAEREVEQIRRPSPPAPLPPPFFNFVILIFLIAPPAVICTHHATSLSGSGVSLSALDEQQVKWNITRK